MDPHGRRARLERSRLYVVSDARADRGDLRDFLAAILEAGTDIVQLREKEAEATDLLGWSEVFREEADRAGALFLLNDRPDVALAAGADGVHLGQHDLPARFVRDLVGDDVLIGLSTRTATQWDRASGEADYLCAGPVWATPTKPGRPAAGLDHVRYAAGRERGPWFAIGGIDPSNVAQVVAAGARRIVVVRAVTEAPDPGEAARTLVKALPPAEVAGSVC